MDAYTLNNKNELEVLPSASSSPADFDFLVGKWRIHNRKLRSRLNNCIEWIEFEATGEMRKILQGLGNIDSFLTTVDNETFEGMTLRLFNPKTKLWSIYWSASNTGTLDVPVVGSFENKTGHFYAKDRFNETDILVVFHWDATDQNKPIWSQAFSADKGKTWEWNWYMYMERE